MEKDLLTYVLDHIVPKRVPNEREGVASDLRNKCRLLWPCGMVDAALKYAATMTVGSNGYAVEPHCMKDELQYCQIIKPKQGVWEVRLT